MMRNQSRVMCVVLVAVVGLALGCSRGPSEEELKLAAFQEQFAETKLAYEDLMNVRSEIETARVILAELEAIDENKLTEEQQAQLDETRTAIEASLAASETAFEELQGKLADLLNIGINEFPDSSETAAALVIYSDEAILVADDMVAKAGDYKKAIDHLSNAEGYFVAAGLTPYHPLVAKIAELDDWRFITQERFDQVKKGMTKEEVAATVGQVYYRNVQESPSKGVETWLYKKREGGAAAFYFKIKTGKVYDKNFDAIEVRAAED
jgi:outer membrane protein assembly factor BamE (lipoprotein component of BamABCDE complex)